MAVIIQQYMVVLLFSLAHVVSQTVALVILLVEMRPVPTTFKNYLRYYSLDYVDILVT